MLPLLFFISQASIGPFTDPKKHVLHLKAGKYKIHCYGGQGGAGYDDGKIHSEGGKGAHVSGTIKIDGPEVTFYAYVGGVGTSGPAGGNEGGFNGGGASGKDEETSVWPPWGTVDGDDGPGGGGGASDIRITEDINTRIMVAAGGSGAAGYAPGAPGGDLNGRYTYCIGCSKPGIYQCSEYPIKISDKTTQTSGSSILGRGEDGMKKNTTPGSGGGGGWQGGVSSGGTSGGTSCFDSSVAHSGSSYISGYDGCKQHDKYIFEDCIMEVGEHAGVGKITVEIIYQCKDNCAKCTSNFDCIECLKPYRLLDDTCYLNCPDGSRPLSDDKCEKCTIADCSKCPSSTNSCETCKKGTNLLIENGVTKCVANCNPGQIALDGRCVPCNDECSSCSISKDFCDSCKGDKFVYNGKCYSNCADLNVESNNQYYGQDNDNKECKNCVDNHCIDCSSDFNQCTKCSSLYYFDQKTGKCVIKPTSTFTSSHIFSDSKQFTNTKPFSNSEHFTNSKLFSNSKKFSNTKPFSNSEHFTNTKPFSNSEHFSNSLNSYTEIYDISSQSIIEQTSEGFNSGQTSEESKSEQKSEEFNSEQTSEESKSEQTSEEFISGQTSEESKFGQTSEEPKSEQTSEEFNSEQISDEFISSTSEPIDATRLSCEVSYDNEKINLYDRCVFSGSEKNNAIVTLMRTLFDNFVSDSDGGSIYINDCSIQFNNTNFTKCVSTNGGGGAIYIKNSINTKKDIIFENIIFTECKAKYGGAVFLLSYSESSNISFKFCIFNSNKVTNNKSNENNEFIGGSALFLCSYECNIYKCQFNNNIGSSGSLKIFNDFQKNKNKKIISHLEQTQKVIVVSDCNFDDSKSSIYYINGKEGSNIEVKNCNFNGISDKKKKYIDGKEYNQGFSQLSIISCDFHYESNILKRNTLCMIVSILTIFFVMAALFSQKLNFNQHEKEDSLII